jgi:pyrroline-5-carboxylate reductase
MPRPRRRQLRINVTSPGGTTAAALEVLMAGDGLDPADAGRLARQNAGR